MIFTYDDKGNLVFECKVPAGKAVDVKSAPGQRWAAFFDSESASSAAAVPLKSEVVNHTAGDADATWLLREGKVREAVSP